MVQTASALVFHVAPSRVELVDGPSFARFHEGLMERLATISGVESVGVGQELPLDEGSDMGRWAATARKPTNFAARLVRSYSNMLHSNISIRSPGSPPDGIVTPRSVP